MLFPPITLNNHFAAIAQAHDSCTIATLSQIVSDIDPYDNSLFRFSFLTYADIKSAAAILLPKSRSRSPDGINLNYVKPDFETIMPSLFTIFNHIIRTNNYPETWKKAYIIPLNKCSSSSSPSDTRPIANLCHFTKLFDKCIAKQIQAYLEQNKLLLDYQFGFRSRHSTQLALLHLTDKIRLGIENGFVTVVLYYDFKKAFDSIRHESLLRSLKSLQFSIEAIRLMHSYITGRSQAVVDHLEHSTAFKSTTSGVPQGSSPGPILFIALINSITSKLKYCKQSYMLFADDLQIFVQCPPNLLDHAISCLNEDSAVISEAARSYGLAFNTTKTKAMCFGSSDNLKAIREYILPPVIVNGHIIEFAYQIKSLGIILTPSLK